MKILIVTAWYAPFIHPRAHRWTAVAEQWASEGHDVQVLTARLRECGQEAVLEGVKIHRVGFDSLKEWVYYWIGSRGARGRVGVKPSRPGISSRFAAWVYKTIWKNLYFPDDACVWYFPAKRKLRQVLESEQFDAVVTVSLPFTGHLLGLATRPTALSPMTGTPIWLADIGDPFSLQAKPPNNLFFYEKKNRRFERQVLETADVVTVTTEATLRKYREQFGGTAIAKMWVVPPLLVTSTINNQQSSIVNSPISTPLILPAGTSVKVGIKIGYFGAFYAPTRTPDAFLDLLAQTFALCPDLRGRLEIHFYGEIFPEFFEKLNAEPAIRLHGLCSRIEVWKAMQEMDILLNIGNTTDFQLPSKAVDYLASGKPVLNLSYVENDPFAEFFREHPMLFNLKIENGKATKAELERWLVWLESKKPTWSNAEIVERMRPFLAENIAKQYLALININLLVKHTKI